MTINAVPSVPPLIDEVILDGYKKAGLLPLEFAIGADTQWAAKAAHGRRTLTRLMNSLAMKGFLEYFVNLDVLDLVAGTHEYTLDADILNVIDDGSYIPASNGLEEEETTGETPVKPMSAFRWNQLSSKASIGTPVHYYIERNATQLVMRLWPVPSEAGKIRFRTHRIPGSHLTGSDNPDFMRHWESWAVKALAYELMEDTKLPVEERQLTRADRDVLMEELKSYDSSNLGPDVFFTHTTPWSGGYR